MATFNGQKLKGNGNLQAGGNIDARYYFGIRKPISFYEKDIKNVIIHFSAIVDKIEEEPAKIKAISLVEKNELNQLSDEYFEIIKSDYMEYFNKIDLFLKDPQNTKILDMYNSTTKELRRKITIRRSEYNNFEDIFDDLYDFILAKNIGDDFSNREIIWVFLHYMYCNCDIGLKSEEEKLDDRTT